MSHNVFYEEEGDFKVGAVLADNLTSLQVEAPHGKRSKIKAAAVLIRFEGGGLADFMVEARRLAEDIDVDFLWQVSGADEFAFDALAREYFGHAPTAVESAALLVRLHGAPMYFYKKGRGRYKGAPREALTAALASIERKRRQQEQKAAYIAQLTAGTLPAEFAPVVDALLYSPDRNSLEWKALEEAAAALKLAPARMLERCGALSSPDEYHLRRFLFEHFPRGAGFPEAEVSPAPDDLPLAAVEAFSIDDATTTEIDDAFSVTRLSNGNLSVGIHIAAPALGIAPGSPLDAVARERLATVYYPGGKITMLPEAAIGAYTLGEGRTVPALSMYLEVAPDSTVVASETRVERVPIAANLRHESLDAAGTQAAFESTALEHRYGAELTALWRLASRLAAARRRDEQEIELRPEFAFSIEQGRVRISPRLRGTPVDRIVSELMIHVNGGWGQLLAREGAAAIYRVQAGGKVRMSTVPAGHEGLGVESYAWTSSPLRRYVDLVNQRQLLALARGTALPYRPDEALLAAMRDFEAAHEAYGAFQRDMERYWSLRWLLQEEHTSVTATVIRDNLVRFAEVPLVVRVPSAPPGGEQGTRVRLALSRIDLLDLTLHCEFTGFVEAPEAADVRDN